MVRSEILSFGSALSTQLDTIGALVLRETHVRFGRTRLGYLWLLIEPIAHIIVLTVIYFMLNRRAPLGGSMPLFLLTGLLPYFLWNKVARRLSTTFTSDRALLHLPVITGFDLLVARSFLEGVTWLLVASALISILVVTGHGHWPTHVTSLAGVVAVTFMLSFGIGTINAVLGKMFSSWQNIFDIAIRPLYICSGIFYLVDQLPAAIKSILIWNPIVHAIEWFRYSFYPTYSSATMDQAYLIKFSVIVFSLALLVERLALRRVSSE
jgi:capsular polysaccharide transport system permease protein